MISMSYVNMLVDYSKFYVCKLIFVKYIFNVNISQHVTLMSNEAVKNQTPEIWSFNLWLA